jgi:hypothetical protein
LAVAGAAGFGEESGECCDCLEQQRVEFGLLAGGALGAEAGDEPFPSGGGLLLVLGGLPAGLVACPPPAQRLGADHGAGVGMPASGGELAGPGGGVSRG